MEYPKIGYVVVMGAAVLSLALVVPGAARADAGAEAQAVQVAKKVARLLAKDDIAGASAYYSPGMRRNTEAQLRSSIRTLSQLEVLGGGAKKISAKVTDRDTSSGGQDLLRVQVVTEGMNKRRMTVAYDMASMDGEWLVFSIRFIKAVPPL